MFTVEVDKRVKGDSQTIWQVITNAQFFAEAAPNILRVEELGGEATSLSRRIHHKSGRNWEEHCKQWQPQDKFTMQISTENYPLPVSSIQRTISMQQMKRSTLITIQYDYTAQYGPLGFFIDKYQIRPVLKIFATQLLDNLARKINQTGDNRIISAQTILESKDSTIYTITPTTLIAEACKILTEKRIGCVIALDETNKIAGILSERDIVNAIANADEPVLNNQAKQHMTSNVILCHPDDSIDELMSSMSERRIRHLPVVDDNETLLGVISIGDIINHRMSELELESDAMHQYIEGRKWREVAMQIGRDAASEEFS